MPEERNPTMTQNFIHDFIDEDIAQGCLLYTSDAADD